MKKINCHCALFIGWIMFLTQPLFAQEVDTTYAARMNYIFKFLDKGKIPTGILKDAALEMAELNYYKGTVLQDSNQVFSENWNDIYLTLATAQIYPNPAVKFPHPSKVDSIWFAKRKPGQITLAGLYYKYSRFADDGANKVTILNDQIYDKYVNGIWQNPYTIESVIAFAPATIKYDVLGLNILLPAELWLSNHKAQVNSIQVDAGDGLGYRLLQPDILLPVQYYTNGNKMLKFKITLNDNTVLLSHSTIIIQSPVSISHAPDFNNPGNLMNKQGLTEDSALGPESDNMVLEPQVPQITALMPVGWIPTIESMLRDEFLLKSTDTFNGKKTEGLITIVYAKNDKKIRKPLIVAEGFDPDTYTFPEKIKGEKTYDNFVYDVSYSDSPELKTLLSDFNHSYDIIYIDWKDGTADMRLNALLLKTVIMGINQVKVADGGNPIEKNVVLGQSMGGVIARYTLKKMELAGENHDTRLYISHDAPHQGANVSLGIQAMANHLRYLQVKFTDPSNNPYYLFKGYRNPLDLTGTMGAKQLLSNRLNDVYQLDNNVFNSFQNELKNLGYPAQCRNIAISNGSECGTPYPILPGDHLIKLDGYYKTKFLADIFLTLFPIKIIYQSGYSEDNLMDKLPGSHRLNFNIEINTINNGGGNILYKCKVAYKKKILWLIPVNVVLANAQYNAPIGIVTFDTSPGGVALLKNYVDESSLPFSEDDNIFYFSTYKLEIKSGFSFIPTTSALGIGKGLVPLTLNDYYASYTGATPPPVPKNTPFDNFITAYSSGAGNNEEHISFTQRNGAWLAKELNNEVSLANCGIFCSISPNSIIGPATICGTTNYSLSNVPPGATIIWTAWGAIQIQGANNQSTVSVKMNTNGTGTLTAKINLAGSSCGEKSVSRTITATGAPAYQEIEGGYFNNGGLAVPGILTSPDVYPINGISFTVPYVEGVSYQWTVDGNIYGGGQDNEVLVYPPQCGYGYPTWQIFTAKVKMTNSCGSTLVCKQFIFICNPEKHLEPYGSCDTPVPVISELDESFIVFPNPAGSELKVSLSPNTEEQGNAGFNQAHFELALYNEKGKKMLTKKSKNQESDVILDTSILPNGIYYLHIQQGNELIKKQVIIQHE